jgi:hypothetical protein
MIDEFTLRFILDCLSFDGYTSPGKKPQGESTGIQRRLN